MARIRILDSTLREGEQTPGLFFDGHIKLAIARSLDALGVDIIEAGHPVVSPAIHQSVKLIAKLPLNALIGAHARLLKKDVDLALECGVQFLGIFYGVANARLSQVFRTEFSRALDQITEVISYAKSKTPDLTIRYTPEDAVRSSFDNVVDAAFAAVSAGADIISIADTTGYMVPGTERSMYDYVTRLKDSLSRRGVEPIIAVHCHNDRGLALANALDAYRAGAEIIDTTIMGLGERTGIVDLAQLLTCLTLDFDAGRKWNLGKLQGLYTLVSEYSGVPIPANLPLLGAHAFTHCAGVHTHAAAVNPLHYQSIPPEILGRRMEVALDHMSGMSSILWAFDQLGIEVNKSLADQVLGIVKAMGQRGRSVSLKELEHIHQWCQVSDTSGAAGMHITD